MNKDYYDILGVSKSASNEEIKRAYRKKALEHHPDRGGNSAKFKEINEAYQILSDPQKRSQFDQFGSAAFGGAGAGGPGYGYGDYGDFARQAGGQGFDFGDGQGFEFSFGGGLGDIFGDLFSQAFSTVQAEVEISPAQAVLGDTINVSIGSDKIELEIPAGVQDGTQFRFRGKGRRMRNGQKGDLILAVRVKIPRRVSREQKELWEQLKEAEHIKKRWWQR